MMQFLIKVNDNLSLGKSIRFEWHEAHVRHQEELITRQDHCQRKVRNIEGRSFQKLRRQRQRHMIKKQTIINYGTIHNTHIPGFLI